MPSPAKVRKGHFFRHFLKSLDTIFFLHIVIIYLHDVSTFRLLLRSIVHLTCIPATRSTIFHFINSATPLTYRLNNYRHLIILIVLTNVYCVARHAFKSYPTPVYASLDAATTASSLLASTSSFSRFSTNMSNNPTSDPANSVSDSQQLQPQGLFSFISSAMLAAFSSSFSSLFVSQQTLNAVPAIHQSPLNVLTGGFTIEFIGELPFGSPLAFILLDLAVFVLQVIMFCMAVGQLEKNMITAGTGAIVSTAGSTVSTNANASNNNNSSSSGENQSIAGESQTGNENSTATATTTNQNPNQEEEEGQDQDQEPEPNEEGDIISLSNTYSGSCIVYDIHIFEILKTLWINNAISEPGNENETETGTRTGNDNNNDVEQQTTTFTAAAPFPLPPSLSFS